MFWPSTIPHDLKNALATTQTPDQRSRVFRAWAMRHGLHLKLQWLRSLDLDMSELNRHRTTPTDQDRWGVIQEWLERHGVEVPDKLPVAPESPGGKFE